MDTVAINGEANHITFTHERCFIFNPASSMFLR